MRTERGRRLMAMTLSEDDPRVGTIKVHAPGEGILTTTYQWETPELAAQQLPHAAERALAEPAAREAGERRRVVRIEMRAVDIYVGWLGGPPTWRLPKVGGRRESGYVEVMVGWWRRALVLGWQCRDHDPGE